jgi:hypothetical protein
MVLITKLPEEETIKNYALHDLQSQALSGSKYADHIFAVHKTT